MIPWLSRKRADAPAADAAPPGAPQIEPGRRSGWAWRRAGRWALYAFLGLFLLAVGWATWVAPPWGSMQAPQKPAMIYISADGTPIARRGEHDVPVDAASLPLRVKGAFIAIEDRRFASHHGVDLRGLIRASWRNLRAGGVVEGGSTITQQLAKNAFLTSERRIGRKLQEFVLAVWLDAWLSKDEILSRYLSTIYFGDGSHGLRAAARHYFQKTPENLSVGEAAMLAAMVKAPSRLNPVADLDAAQARSRLVLAAMAREGMISPAEASSARLAKPNVADDELPGGTYFVDWLAPQVEAGIRDGAGQVEIHTTLDGGLQKAAIRALTTVLSRQGDAVHATQAALVAMRLDGSVVAMIGGRSYRTSPYNRVTQAERQPGSAFKLAVYLAAFENGSTPDTAVENGPLTVDGWTPRNYGGRYGPPTTLRNAFAQSSNVAAVRIAEQVGRNKVVDVARRLGITAPITPGPSMALGSSGMTLLELTAAYAAVASGHYPVRPTGLADAGAPTESHALDPRARESMLDLLWTATNQGTGRGAALGIPSFGKTGTTQNYRDALFVGFAGGLVTGVWVGNDDDSPMRGVTGGTLPAEIWRSFMSQANLHEDDLPLPETLRMSIAQRQEAMRQAALDRELEALQAAEEEEQSPLERFFDGLVPGFLRSDRSRRLQELREERDRGWPEEDDRTPEERRRDDLRWEREQERDPQF
ncbi:hypothetical protein ASE00_08815 [Sphingomonas sp. Root710]|uniref:transglycosylase domain-containing protein n=1 Tax=Sphingomonas sp. Root710 TaxID=1736594 RepID=UPI0006F22FC8|nr:transglycosylase domain-containing protein [Sphingomonas sp. Root710]KRB82192.1 hypothetical protein ASE00_08815 [Sphingomonas sp. Root710]